MAATATPKRRFRVIAGRHVEQRVETRVVDEPDGRKVRREVITDVGYGPGDIVETEFDLLSLNRQGMPPKFADAEDPGSVRLSPTARVWDPASGETIEQFAERMKTEVTPAAPKKTLEAMSLKELQDLAANDEIDLRGAKTVAEAIKIIKASR